jgi:hypothetical protein
MPERRGDREVLKLALHGTLSNGRYGFMSLKISDWLALKMMDAPLCPDGRWS